MVYINGCEQAANGKSVVDVIDEMNIDIRTIAVELNEEIVSKADYDKTTLKDGDVLEVVSFVGGG
ncbi:sulfur carrier protein ThiS [Pseudobutyrivibrio sp.]|uniref:sulfur carrier protein ThiS n=1 Tax=Pseudobutyrivibrio sp. TaxID=2014367 RepID=UPI001B2D221E|nr:sulfur carrier protein ThiS [Pseudobutyrivibrio sp.]MBO5617444.1 sulfur carrier protein ThiS [Pseudobutyrivibrio sp.]MBP3261355.1 sulfur carrier protein ThiS [Pseudobutyrivibrio sp.]